MYQGISVADPAHFIVRGACNLEVIYIYFGGGVLTDCECGCKMMGGLGAYLWSPRMVFGLLGVPYRYVLHIFSPSLMHYKS